MRSTAELMLEGSWQEAAEAGAMDMFEVVQADMAGNHLAVWSVVD
jgi:hypothetical protein